MKRLFLYRSALGMISVLVGIMFATVSCSNSDSSSPGTAGLANSSVVNFIATDEPGPWFKCVGNGCVSAKTESLAIVKPNTNVKITMGKESNTVHTFTSLLYPTGAKNMPFDQKAAFRGSRVVKLVDPGLYVFVCKLHPFMLAATIVDDPATVDTITPPLSRQLRRDRHMTSARASRSSAMAASASPRRVTWPPSWCEHFS